MIYVHVFPALSRIVLIVLVKLKFGQATKLITSEQLISLVTGLVTDGGIAPPLLCEILFR